MYLRCILYDNEAEMISFILKDFPLNTFFDTVITSSTWILVPRSINVLYSIFGFSWCNFHCFWITITDFTSFIPLKISHYIESRSLSMLWRTHKDYLFRILGLRLLLFFFFFFFCIILMRTCLINSIWLITALKQPDNGFSVILFNHQLIQFHILIFSNISNF